MPKFLSLLSKDSKKFHHAQDLADEIGLFGSTSSGQGILRVPDFDSENSTKWDRRKKIIGIRELG